MKIKISFLFALFIAGAAVVATAVIAQQQAPPPGQPPQPGGPTDQRNPPHPPKPDPLNDVMFPPDLVLSHARQLGLSDEQKNFIRGEIQKTTTSFNELQWKLQDEMELLHDALKPVSVNEQQALAQLNKVLDIEREIKRLHIGLAVRIKNRLTPEQQAQLQHMRSEPPRNAPPPGGPPRPPEF